MKKLLVIVAAVFVASVAASAKGGFGVTAGVNTNSTKIQDVQTAPRTGFNVGVTYSLNLPLGFSVQPSVVYSHKSANISLTGVGVLDALVSDKVFQNVGSVNVPVSVQWGPDLIVARPFLDITPYVGYTLSNTIKGMAGDVQSALKGEKSLDYGVGLGGGLHVWKLQAIVRYNWSFGTMGNLEGFTELDLDDVKNTNRVYGGLSVNLAYFF
ncbi:MAG: PorT family protein [Bacteroidales bacterium]|nr:PorT family protein [Bacteroidales bacterium]